MTPVEMIAIALSYLLGAVPFGLLISKAKGIDIRKHGSGNIGATNVLRVVGKPWGITTFALDALKGLVPAAIFPRVMAGGLDPVLLSVLCGVAAIVGHNFPVYLGFKGGKGVATSAGVLIGIAWKAALAGLGAWAVFFFAFRYVSLASILAALVVGIGGWWIYPGQTLLCAVLSILSALVILRHRSNIVRLIQGTESTFKRKDT